MKKRASLIAILLIVISAGLVESMNVTITSPVNGTFYSSGLVSMNASCDETVNWKAFIDGAYYTQHNNDNVFTETFLDLSEGLHAIIISASNSSANINNTVNFYVDAAFPNITSQTPANNTNVSRGNVNFSVSYTETNLSSAKIYWKNSTDSAYSVESISGCDSGASKSCSKTINFSSASYGANISYFFNLIDSASRVSNASVYTFRLSCTPSWSCTEWSTCSGTQTRTCTDTNNCSISDGEPAENQTCTVCTPSWTSHGSWSSCSGGTQTRTHTDANACGVSTGKPADDSQTCSDSASTTSGTGTGGTQSSTEIQNVNYFISEPVLKNGSSRTLRKIGDKITFKINNESHVLELIKILSDRVSIKISSKVQYANLTLDATNKFDLTEDNYYDVIVILKKFNASEANILLNATNEKAPETASTANKITSALAATNTIQNASAAASDTASSAASNETGINPDSKVTGTVLGAIENLRKAPVYIFIALAIVIAGLAATTYMILKKKHKKLRQWGYR